MRRPRRNVTRSVASAVIRCWSPLSVAVRYTAVEEASARDFSRRPVRVVRADGLRTRGRDTDSAVSSPGSWPGVSERAASTPSKSLPAAWSAAGVREDEVLWTAWKPPANCPLRTVPRCCAAPSAALSPVS